MRRALHFITRYCCKCHGTTRWELEGRVYRCIGDDDRHPERKIHGCGTKIDSIDSKVMTLSAVKDEKK